MCVLYIDPLLDFEQSVLYSRIVELLMAKTFANTGGVSQARGICVAHCQSF